MSELTFLAALQKRVGRSRLALGIGDDCAIYRPRADEELVFTTDFLIEDVHFTQPLYAPEAIGHKALARSLSDIAAMGATPRFALLSLALSPTAGARWRRRFFDGFLALASRTRTELAGGDLSHADRIICDVMVCGSVKRGQALRRDRARAGEMIYTSGELGKPWQTHQKPEPRLALGRALMKRGVRCAIDISDGLALDLHRVLLGSRCAAQIEGPLPLATDAEESAALHGGEDYELLFTGPPRLPRRMGGVAVTPIGRVVAGPAGRIHYKGRPLRPGGYDHLKPSR